MTRDELIHSARRFLGTPWRHQGRSLNGVDCVGLLYLVIEQHGLETNRVDAYSMRPGSARLYAELERYCDQIPVIDRAAGDIMVAAVEHEDPQHTMLLTGPWSVIHASARHRKVVEHSIDHTVMNRVSRVYRLREIDG